MPTAFNNQRLFSDYYLDSVVPTSSEWSSIDAPASEAQATLRELWSSVKTLVGGHEGQTEEHWIRPVLGLLGYSFQVQTAVPDAEGTIRWPDYALFSSAELRNAAAPFAGAVEYFVGAIGVADAKVWDAPLDRSSDSGSGFNRLNPNYQIDAYLRETNQAWGMLTNGRLWRLYNRETSYRLDTYFEIDLIELLDGDIESFKYFWAFFRPQALEGQPVSFADRTRLGSEEYAEALSGRVKVRIYEALTAFINGFFEYPENNLDPVADLKEAYDNSLILLYRILFALYAEAHGLLPTDNGAYRDTYSILRIKQALAHRLDTGGALLPHANNYFADLKSLFTIIDRGAPQISVPPYNGGLFDDSKYPFLARNEIGDAQLAAGLDQLVRVPSEDGLVFVDFRTLEVRHLGDIYEGLLEYHPRLADEDMVAVRRGGSETWKAASQMVDGDRPVARVDAGKIFLATGQGERRATGSYYTPETIVNLMLDESLGRTIKRLEHEFSGEDLTAALLELRVCDPAVGSGHFLIGALDHIARAIVRSGSATSPGDSELQSARRAVVERCVYGMDPNPLAVELAKLSLWLATVAKDRPLSFVDAHLICGNSVIGTSIEEMATLRGSGGPQMNFVEEALGNVAPEMLELISAITESASDSVADIEGKKVQFDRLNALRASFVGTANLKTARSFGIDVSEDSYLQAVTLLADDEPNFAQVPDWATAQEAAQRYRFNHWELAFPEIFLNPNRPRGFDLVITNPPYVSANERNQAFDDLTNAYWRREFDSASGAFDLYILFMEIGPRLAKPGGFSCLITPNKFLAAPYASKLREHLVDHHSLEALVDASRVSVFEDPSVYPVITLFSAHEDSDSETDVWRLEGAGSLHLVGSHPSAALTRLPENLWAYLLLEDADLILRLGEDSPQLEGFRGMRAVASTTAAEADGYGQEIREEHLATQPGWPILVTGTIGELSSRWGLSLLKHQGRAFLRPVLPFRSDAVSNNRRDAYWAPKLIVRKLGTSLEATLDPDGTFASMNTNFIFPGTVDIFAVGAIVHSTLMSWIYEGYFGALRMGGGYLQFQAPQLRSLPMPPLPDLSPEILDQLAEGYDPVDLDLPAAAQESDLAVQYALLRLSGSAWYTKAIEIAELRGSLVGKIMDALDLTKRRDTEPSFVIPRQDRILEEATNLESPDLAAFWRPLRQSAGDLGVTISPTVTDSIVDAVQSLRADLTQPSQDLGVIQRNVDGLVYSLFGLTSDEIESVESGHEGALQLLDA
ncbi:MAG: Eco57I restriction-modification methylase domain-containing protein [Thermoleophilia bacterium]|nr:Eco57I restriction-modification methylase domain-containing protein [Thermoleophilia bacterium]